MGASPAGVEYAQKRANNLNGRTAERVKRLNVSGNGLYSLYRGSNGQKALAKVRALGAFTSILHHVCKVDGLTLPDDRPNELNAPDRTNGRTGRTIGGRYSCSQVLDVKSGCKGG
ncbi:hypothetical protein EVA_12905 [gut metagenome]|uniref:Uncharacterized protein n=1 Tax=gut metagenome TaxID=749906 RepID=J9GHP5_9ZZZZ